MMAPMTDSASGPRPCQPARRAAAYGAKVFPVAATTSAASLTSDAALDRSPPNMSAPASVLSAQGSIVSAPIDLSVCTWRDARACQLSWSHSSVAALDASPAHPVSRRELIVREATERSTQDRRRSSGAVGQDHREPVDEELLGACVVGSRGRRPSRIGRLVECDATGQVAGDHRRIEGCEVRRT